MFETMRKRRLSEAMREKFAGVDGGKGENYTILKFQILIMNTSFRFTKFCRNFEAEFVVNGIFMNEYVKQVYASQLTEVYAISMHECHQIFK